MKLLISYFLIASLGFLLMRCNSQNQQDPFWGINLDNSDEEIIEQLRTSSDIKAQLFSFEKKIIWKEYEGKALVKSYLNRPLFENGKLKELYYTLSVDLKNGETFQFNTAFYEFLKQEMEQAFGIPHKVQEVNNTITLQWNLERGTVLNINGSKQFNNYSIEYTRNDSSAEK